VHKQACKYIASLLTMILLTSCGGGTLLKEEYNDTTHIADIEDRARAPEMKKLVLATVNFSKPSRVYMQDFEPKIDNMLIEYMERQGYTFLPPHVFANAWNTAIRQTGDSYDPSTGRFKTDTHMKALALTLDYIKQNSDAAGILFTDLLEYEVAYMDGNKHNAKWHGVTRRFKKMGVGNNVPADFDWGRPSAVASLWVNIFDVEAMQRIFSGVGGIDSMEAINMKLSEPRFTRNKKLFDNNDNIEEGIQLALHPLINMPNWPGIKPE
jgi:hypothetical protein